MHHALLRTMRTQSLAALAVTLVAAGPAPRIAIESGTPQTARAWVAARADRYESHYDKALTVHVSPATLKVRFSCITRGCEFPAQDQPDSVARVNPSTYDVTAAKGVAAIKLVIWTVTPESVVVSAQASDGPAQPQVRFVLNQI